MAAHDPETPSVNEAAQRPSLADPAVEALASPLLDAAFLRPQRLGVISAWYGHVPFAHWIATAASPLVLVELGTHWGVSYFAFCEALAQRIRSGRGRDVRAYAVDTWEGDPHAGEYGNEVFDDVRRFHDERYRGFSTLLRGTFEQAAAHFAEGEVDLLHIDGFHTEAAVRADWECWRPKLSEQAVVLFHDTNVRAGDFGVWRLWAELRRSHPGFEFLHSHGLGVLAYGRHAPTPVRALCGLSGDAAATVRERFALLGERWEEAAERRGNIAAQQRAEAALAGKRLELEHAVAANDAAFAERDTTQGYLGTAEAHIAKLDADLLAVRAEAARAEALEQALQAARVELTDAQEMAERLRAEAAQEAERTARAISAATAGIAAERDRLAAERDAYEAALRQERHRMGLLTGSAAWRAAAPLRRLEARFPRAVRTIGRGLRLAALTAAGRLPAHLRLRRQVRADADALRASPLFDPADYLARYPDVARSGADPLWHYIWTGAAGGYDPHPLFASRDYLARHPELAPAGVSPPVNPLAHYLREGAALGHDPHPLFDTAHYLAQQPDETGDRAAAEANPLLHYLQTGAALGRDPNPFFDVDGYWETYLRDNPASREPLSHYLVEGASRGHDPHPLFDTDWYARRHPESGGSPLAHFLRHGRPAGDAPSLAWKSGCTAPPALRFRGWDAPDVSIIIPAYGRLFDTLRCLYAVMAHSGEQIRYEVIVIDDKPAAPTAPVLRAIPGLQVEVNPANLGFLRSCNRGAAAAAGRYLVFLNNDTCVHPGWLEALVDLAERDPRAGMVGGMLLNADGSVQEAGGILFSDGWGEPYGRGLNPSRPELGFVREVDVVIGACMLVRARAWIEVGGFDDDFAPAYYEEFDLAFALRRRDWRVLYQPASRVTHFDASSYGAAERDRQSVINHDRFCRKWAEEVAAQPARGAPLFLARARAENGGVPASRRIGGRILFVDDRVPEPDKHAGSVSTLHWLRLLAESGWLVTFAPHDQDRPEPYTSALQQLGIEVLYGPIDLPAWLAANGRYLDHVWTARPDVTEPLIEAIERHAPGRMIYFTHDLHSLREQRRYALDEAIGGAVGGGGALREARRLRRVESRIFRASRLVITPSEDELPEIRAMAPGVPARAVPLYSVPATPWAETDPARFAGRNTVLFVGGYAHPPNEDAALFLAREIMPLIWRSVPDARLLLVGSKPTPAVRGLAGEKVEVAGWLPDLEDAYGRSRVSLSPLRYGAGVKGKIIAALEAGVPVVTTPVGNEGLGLAAEVEALIGEDAAALAAAAIRLLEDSVLCARLAAAGTAALRRRFDEGGARRVLEEVLGAGTCPCCGVQAALPERGDECTACGASAFERAAASAVLRPWRSGRVASLREAAKLLDRQAIGLPAGPLARALPKGPAMRENDLDLLVSGPDETEGEDRVGTGGRWIRPGGETEAARLTAAGWEVRLFPGPPDLLDARRPS